MTYQFENFNGALTMTSFTSDAFKVFAHQLGGNFNSVIHDQTFTLHWILQHTRHPWSQYVQLYVIIMADMLRILPVHDPLPLKNTDNSTCISVTIYQRNDGSDIPTTLRSPNAKYHKTCRSYCCSSHLKRARQKQDNIPDNSQKKTQVIIDIWGRKSGCELPYHLWGNRPERSA